MLQLQVFFTLYAVSVPIFFALDMLWLGVIAHSFYQNRIGHLLGEVHWVTVIIFYLIFLLGLTFFAMYPAVTKGTVLSAVALGALFGFFTYATYDLTNLATLRSWPIPVAIVDIFWGTLLGGFVSLVTVYIYKTFIT